MRRVHVTGTDRRGDTVAAVEDGGAWRLFLPFPEHMIEAAALLGSDRLLCLSDQAEICLIDWRADKEIARRRIPLLKLRRARLLVTADAGLIVIHSTQSELDPMQYPHSLHILRAADLEPIVEGDALQWLPGLTVGRILDRGAETAAGTGSGQVADLQIMGKVIEDETGRLVLVARDCGRGASRRGLCRIGRSDGAVHVAPVPDEAGGPWGWFSASGRYAVAPHTGVPLIHAVSWEEQESHREAAQQGAERNKGRLELWTTEPPRLAALIATGRGLPADWINDVVWEPDETAFWVKLSGFSRRIGFQRVGLDGSLSPVFSFQRFRDRNYPFLQDIADLADPQQVAVRVDFDMAYIQRDWCRSDLPFRLIPEEEDGFRKAASPHPTEAAVRRFLARSERRHVVAVRDFSEAAIADALGRLTRDIREGLADLLQNDVLEFSFKVGKRGMSETAFFAAVTRERIPVAAALRELLTTYLAVQPRVIEAKRMFRQIWGPEGQGALAPAMQALLHLDPDAHDVFRGYLAKRDGEHETHSTDVVMKRYVREAGWRDRAMIGFGVYFALIRHRDGRSALAGGLLDEYGLLQAAARMIDADDFATLVMQEIDCFVLDPGLDAGDKEELYEALQPSLAMTAHGRQALAIIASRRGTA